MSVLTKKEIIKLIKNKKLVFTPQLDAFQLQPHAVDLRLGSLFYIPKTWQMTVEGRKAIELDPLNVQIGSSNFEKISLKNGQYFELLPKEYIIASTMEKIKINTNNIMGILYPRSSINRRGLAVDLTGIIDVWYSGPLMIPIINNTQNQTIRLYPGERICQVAFETLSGPIDKVNENKHGISCAKYSNCSEVDCKIDKPMEIRHIKEGKIEDLKNKYPIL